MDSLLLAFDAAQQWLFVQLIQPLAFWAGAGNLLEEGYAATRWLLVGVLQIAAMALLLGPAQRRWPVEPVLDRRAVRVDVLYTLLHRLGLFKLLMFFSVEAWALEAFGWLRVRGLSAFQIDQLWPGVTDIAWVSFVIYLVVFDFVGYWVHRWQHRWHWWWQLHAVHHSQRQMTMWTDNRNHLLDSVITDALMVTLALLIGVGPSQFVALVALSQLMESLQHANLRWPWPAWLERLLVSPRFHRHHHALAYSHEPDEALPAAAGLPVAGMGAGTAAVPRAPDRFGVNYGVLLPWWDQWFGSADWRGGYSATGIDDQVLHGRDYGRGFWAQQWLGLCRLAGLARRQR